MDFSKVKKFLDSEYAKFGKYNKEYYDVGYWLRTLGLDISPADAIKKISIPTELFPDTLELIKKLRGKITLALTSTAARVFINAELGAHVNLFDHTFSSVDDFNMGGKPPELYSMICEVVKISPAELLHVGDDLEMDVKNAQSAGVNAFYFDPEVKRDKLLAKLREVVWMI